MPKYKVVLKGVADSTEAGTRAFLERFGGSYNMSPDEARDWISRAERIIYRFDDLESAERARTWLETIGGVAEVCVHPDFRGRGFVKRILAVIHEWLASQGFIFACLFGDPKVYGSSGYVLKTNLYHDPVSEDGRLHRQQVDVMVKEVSDTSWPDGRVFLPGLIF